MRNQPLSPDQIRFNQLVLASASPRRMALLKQIGVRVVQSPVDIDETPLLHESADQYVERLARTKASVGFNTGVDYPVLGADTCVVLDGDILGKPANEAEALAYLQRLSGRWHQVKTAIALCWQDTQMSEVITAEVEFMPLTTAMQAAYWQTGEPCDKAGGYAIQGLGAAFVKQVRGSYSAVVGLPLAETAQLLTAMGIPIWQEQ